MVKIRIAVPFNKIDSYDIFLNVSLYITWADLEYYFTVTHKIPEYPLYYNGAKLWHLTNQLGYDQGYFPDNDDTLIKCGMNTNSTIYLVWDEDTPDSP